ncbi:hypothetical protein BaRGS_00013977, partial [Batillaria attramentaria]
MLPSAPRSQLPERGTRSSPPGTSPQDKVLASRLVADHRDAKVRQTLPFKISEFLNQFDSSS